MIIIIPVEVLRGSNGDDGVGVGERCEDADSVICEHKLCGQHGGVGGAGWRGKTIMDEDLLVGAFKSGAYSHDCLVSSIFFFFFFFFRVCVLQ